MGSVASTIGGGLVGGPFGALVGGALSSGSGQAAPNQMVNQVNPQLQQIQQQQLAQAQNFRANLGNYESDLNNSTTDAYRNNLAQGIKQSNTNANARGMLYGGYAQNQANQVSAKNAAGLNNSITANNTNAQNQANTLDNQAISSGVGLQGLNQNYNNQIYNTALQQQQNRASGINGLVNMGTQFAGYGLAGA